MSARRRGRSRSTASNFTNAPKGMLPEETRPEAPEQDFDVSSIVLEMNAATVDAAWYCKLMDQAEKTRLCQWLGKTGTGRKDDSRASKAKPWPGAADHEVHLVQELLDERDAARVAALARGALQVTPTEGTDARKAGKMKQVLRYYLSTAMKSQVLVHGTRFGSWSDRWGHSLLYVGWKTERAVERRTITLGKLVEAAVMGQDAENPGAGGMGQGAGGQIQIIAEEMVMESVLNPYLIDRAAGFLLAADEGLQARGTAGLNEAKRAIGELRRSKEAKAATDSAAAMQLEVSYVSSFVKTSAPIWEALRPFIDVFYPAETIFEDNLDGARWIARRKRLSAQQLREQAVIHQWDPDWVEDVIKNTRGKDSGISQFAGVSWGMNGLGTNWSARSRSAGLSASGGMTESQRNLFEIVELWDRSTTPDGLTGTYHTVFHPLIKDKIAKRKLLEYWCGCYPFVPCTSEKSELMLLDSRGVPERLRDDQDALKVQKDSRTNAASLTTLPIWTGPAELRGTVVRPGQFLESYRTGEITALQIPPPDGRSVEIEASIMRRVDRRFGRMSETVPEAVSMLMGQADMDWFLSSMSQAMALTAKLIQQFMPPLKGARITGTQDNDTFDATPEEVRGSYDFSVSFDVRGLDMDWATEMLTFVKDMLIPLDRRGQIKTGPLIEFGLNILSPSLTDRCYVEEEEANQQEVGATKASIADIFTGGAGEDPHEGMDFETRAQTMVDEFKRSPLRQQVVQTNPQIREVFTSRLKQLVDSVKQYRDNVIIGQQMGEAPLQPQSDAEQLLGALKAPGSEAATPV